MAKKIQQIDFMCEVGDRVFYKNFRDEKFDGTLIEWKEEAGMLLAVIEFDDGSTKEIEC